MAVQCPKIRPTAEAGFHVMGRPLPRRTRSKVSFGVPNKALKLGISVLSGGDSSISSKKAAATNSNCVFPVDKSPCITRSLAEILGDLNKRIPDPIFKINDDRSTFIPWYRANRMLSFYAPGWCGEVRDVIFSENGSVSVVYRVTVRGLDGEVHRESSGTVSSGNGDIADQVAEAEEIAFCRACSRFGLGLYLYHQDQ
ncbi:DNA repair RAD52-like protein 2, chloroplastic [Salvia divinorum]|uniref:DNA repair RAD52-like protein 2, chloroplastic n=1 Tax=Salvia divinorum TaxID=28513 RepID=A0ABD1GVU5_SALDI